MAPVLNLNSTTDLAEALGVNERALRITTRKAPFLYREIPLSKKDGTPRIIRAPEDALKIVQRLILDKILVTIPLPECAYGFGKGRSIIENAHLHSKGEYLLSVDIRDFFPSVHISRVEKILVALGSTADATTALVRLTTLEYSLPQGAPTSPYLANLALANLDRRVVKLCATNRLLYSRYFDDITISGGKRAHEVLDTLEKIIEMEGYKMHKGPDKLRLSGPNDERLVTGIFIRNGKLCAPQVKEVLDYIHILQDEGLAALNNENPEKEKMSLIGKINFIIQVDQAAGKQISDEFDKIVW